MNINKKSSYLQDIKEKGITAKELTVKLGMTETGLGIVISEKGNPPLKRLHEIADALGVPVTDLFERPKQNVITCPNCGTRLEIKEEH